MRIYIIILSLLFCSLYNKGQDTLLLMTGKKMIVAEYQLVERGNFIAYTKANGKVKELDLDYIYSITNKNGRTQIYYKIDTLLGNIYTPQEMHSYVMGERYAWEYYKSPFKLITGALFGCGSVFLMHGIGLNFFYAPLVPTGYTVIVGLMSPSTKQAKKKNPEYADDIHFIIGYKDAANKKRVLITLKGAAGGLLLTGVIIGVIAGVVK